MLRPFEPSDYGPLCRIHGDTEVARWLLWEAREPAAVRVSLDRKLQETSLAADGDVLSVAIERDGELIGDCVLVLTSVPNQTGEIGYTLDPIHQGRGYATEAAHALLHIAFGEIGLHRVIGRIEPRNVASAGVLERIGMRREAHLVENEFIKGEWQSEAVYAMLLREWTAR